MDAIMEYEEYEDLESIDGGASVASSDWANLSSGSSTAGDPRTANDVANNRELWEVWSSNQRLSTVNANNVSLEHHMSQIISSVFKFSCHIPYLWLYTQPVNHNPCTSGLQARLVQIAQQNPGFLDGVNVPPSVGPEDALMLAEAALDIHEAALQVSQDESTRFSDDVWASKIHDALIMRCAQGDLLGSSRSWLLPELQLDTLAHPAISQLLEVRKVRPRGAIPIFLPQDDHSRGALFSAAFSTRSEIASHTRDMPEHLVLNAFSNMATSALLSQLASLGINLPVFGVTCDRNLVRFHVDWNVSLSSGHMGTMSLPLPYADRPAISRELDLTRPDDALRVTFMLDALHTYTRHILAPAVRASAIDPAPRNKLAVALGEITSEEKIAAWMNYGDDAFVGPVSEVSV